VPQHRLDLGGVDLLTAADDHVFETADYEEIALLV
jgi:hypothetical protein